MMRQNRCINKRRRTNYTRGGCFADRGLGESPLGPCGKMTPPAQLTDTSAECQAVTWALQPGKSPRIEFGQGQTRACRFRAKSCRVQTRFGRRGRRLAEIGQNQLQPKVGPTPNNSGAMCAEVGGTPHLAHGTREKSKMCFVAMRCMGHVLE